MIAVGTVLVAFGADKERFQRGLVPVLRSQHSLGDKVAFWRRRPRSYERFATARIGYLIL